MNRSRCNCCEKSHGNWGWGKSQDKWNSHDNSMKNLCKCCCCCWEEKEDCNYGKEKEKDFSKCGCSHCNFSNQNYNCAFENKEKDAYGFGNEGKDCYYNWQ